MKLFFSLVTLLLATLSVLSPAFAQQEVRHGRDFAEGRGARDVHRAFARRNERQLSREAAPAFQQVTEQRPIQEQGQTPNQGRERLSPEERRQLRRDINAAGRDIYRRNKSE